MTAPVLQEQGALAAITTGNLTVVLPAHQADDILVVATGGWVPATSGDAAVIAAPGGWTEIAQLGTPAVTIDGRIAWFWKRAASGAETNPVFTRPSGWDTGTDTAWSGRAYVIRGCIATGDPWDEADPTAVYANASQAFDAVTVSGSERMVVQFYVSQDNQTIGAAPTGWTAGTGLTSATGTDSAAQTFRKDNVSTSTGADASNAGTPVQGRYAFLGVSFKPPTSVAHLAAATVMAVSTVAVIATVAHLAAATIAAVSTVTATATAVINHQAQATIGATSSVAAVASVAHPAQATMAAVSSVSASATTTGSATTAIGSVPPQAAASYYYL